MSAPSSSTVTTHPLSTQTCSATGYLDSETSGSQSDFWHPAKAIPPIKRSDKNKDFFIGLFKIVNKILTIL
jgi:hypothetical protein